MCRTTIQEKGQLDYEDGVQDGDYGSYKEDSDVASHTSYNQAVLLFQMKQYGKAYSLLERLFARIEPIEEHLAVRICFLLLDVYFALQLPEKAIAVVTYLDKALAAERERQGVKADPDSESGTNAEPPSEELLAQALTLDKSSEEPSSEALYTLSLDAFTLLLHYYKAQLHLLNKSMKSSKREIKSALATATQGAGTANSPGLFLKSNLEYVRDNYRKSIKLLHGCRKGGGPENQVLYLNNMGCAHFRLGKHNAAAFYFLKALRENNAIQLAEGAGQRGGQVALPTYAKDRSASVQYNLGLQLLLVEQPKNAFACFQEASLMFYNRPRLWLRLAECCISAHVHALDSAEQATSKSDVVRNVVGDGRARRVVLPTGSAAGGDKVVGANGHAPIQGIPTSDTLTYHPHPAPRGDAGGAAAPRFGTLSLEYAVKCLRNCLVRIHPPPPARACRRLAPTEHQIADMCVVRAQFLLSSQANQDAAAAAAPEPEPEPASGGRPTSPHGAAGGAAGAAPSEEAARRQKEVLTVKQAALVYQAYISLSLDDPLSSLSAATELLNLDMQKLTPGNRYLAHTYAAEALCMLDRPGQAEKHLAPTLVSRDSYPAGSVDAAGAAGAAAAAAGGEGGAPEGAGRVAMVSPPPPPSLPNGMPRREPVDKSCATHGKADAVLLAQAQGYGSFLNSREGPEGGTAPGAAGTMPHGGPSAPQFTVFSGDCVSQHSKW